jgi:phospholipase C
MADQIPPGCVPLKTNLDRLSNQLAGLRQALIDADPADRPRIQNLVGAKEREVLHARNAFNACLANPPAPTEPPPPDTIPGIPNECVVSKRTLDRLINELALLRQALIEADPADKPRVQNLVGAKEREVQDNRFILQNCIETFTYPFFNTPPPGNKPNISTDTTPVPQRKVIPWSLVQKKVDALFNKRTDPPIFKIRLHNHFVPGEPQPASDVTITKIKAQIANNQVVCGYEQIGYTDLGRLDYGYYFNDINTSSLNVSITPGASEPITLKINFETGGPLDAPTKVVVLPNMDFLEFSVTVKLTITRKPVNNPGGVTGRLEFFDWIDKLKLLSGDAFAEALKKYVVVRVVSTDTIDPGGKFQVTARSTIFSKLAEPGVREQLSRIISYWMLGQKGDFNVTSVTDDGQNIIINYSVPKNIIDPFPEAEHRGAGWPYKGNPNPDPAIDFSVPAGFANIKQIVVLMMENRSFDHMLGYLSLPLNAGGAGRKDVDGLKGGEFNVFNGVNYPSFPIPAGQTIFGPDPSHSYEGVYHQINSEVDANKNPIPGKGRMDGFVKSFSLEAKARDKGPTLMGYHTADNVPVYDALVRDFGISDHYFASHPGSTFCNRFYELTGRLNLASGLKFTLPAGTWEINNSNPLTPVFTKNIFDYLTDYSKQIEKAVTWKYYEHHYSFIRFFSNYTFDNTNVVDVNDPQTGFFADAKNGTLPSVSYIDPHYIELPPNANADGPVADIKVGQEFVRKVVEAVITSPQYASTLLVITYDEHGGFYDHVPPPPALPYLDESRPDAGPAFPVRTYGVRVPTFFISPWVKAGSVFGHKPDANGQTLYYDHTSVIKTVAKRFMSKNPPYMGKRYAAAKDFSTVLDTKMRKPLFLPFVGYQMTYDRSAMRLNIVGATANGAVTASKELLNTAAQKFSFEQAGDFVYIRTHCGNRYLTANISPDNRTVPPTGFAIRQDIKYDGPLSQSDAAKYNPKFQLWKLTALDTTAAGKTKFTITNAFYPNLVLRPSELVTSPAAVVLTTNDPTYQNVWTVSGPVTG